MTPRDRARGLPLLLIAAAAAALRAYVMHRAGGWHGIAEYDDGVHYGSAALLLHGILPYRDQVFLQPPGITLLLTPFALLGRLAGDATGLAAARVATCVVGGVTTWLVGRLATSRWGRRAGLAAALVYATAAASLVAESTVLLEPYLGLLTVLALRLLPVDRPAVGARAGAVTTRGLFVAGLLLGAATSVKAWGIVTAAVITGWLLVTGRRGAGRLVAGVVVAGVVLCGPFLALAPGRMLYDLVATQLGRPSDGIGPVASRLADMAAARTLVRGHPAEVVALAVAVGLLLAWCAVRAARRDPLGRLLVALVAAGLVMLLLAPPYFTHYADYLVPFVALLCGAAVGEGHPVRRPGRAARPVAAVLVAGLCLLAGEQVASAVRRTVPSTVHLAALRRAVPARGCVLTETPSLAELAGTLVRPGCPVWLDPRGTALTGLRGRDPAHFYPAGFRNLRSWQARWLAWARQARAVVVLGDPCTHPVWTPAVCGYLTREFRLSRVEGAHTGRPPLPVEVWLRR